MPVLAPPRRLRARGLFALCIAILLVGAALRLVFLTVHGIDADEAFYMALARHPLGDLLASFATVRLDRHPKLFDLILHFWLPLAGSSVLAARLVNLLGDLVLGAALMQTGRSVFGRRVAAVAGLLWAINPLLAWADAQVRMYTLLAVFSGLCWLALLHALRRMQSGESAWGWWAAFAIFALGAGYTHIVGLGVVGAAGCVALIQLISHRRWEPLAAGALIGFGYLPYLLNLWAIRGTQVFHTDVIGSKLVFLAALPAPLLESPAFLAIDWTVGVALIVAVLAVVLRRPRPEVLALAAALIILLGTVAFFAISQGIYQPTYLTAAVPPFLLLFALIFDTDKRTLWRVAGATLVCGFCFVGYRAEFNPRQRDDFPAAADFIATHADSGDLILLVDHYSEPPFEYYYSGPGTVIAPWATGAQAGDLEQITDPRNYDTLWVVYYHTNVVDPAGTVEAWLQARFPLRTEVFPAGVAVQAYDLRPVTASLPPEANSLDVQFGDQAALLGYQLYTGSVAARENRLHPPAGWLHVTLYWEALIPGADFTPQVTLEDESGAQYGGQLDRDSGVLAMHPVISWQTGEVWRVDADVLLNTEAPPSSYKVVARALGPDGNPLPVDDAGTTWVIIGRVEVK